MHSIPLDVNNMLMNWYRLRMESLTSADSWMPLSGGTYEFHNFETQPSFSYYAYPNMINGLLIDLDENIQYSNRSVYSWSDWASEVGSFSRSFSIIIMVIVPLFATSSVDSTLIGRLFTIDPQAEPIRQDADRSSQALLRLAEKSVAGRKSLEGQSTNFITNLCKRITMCRKRDRDRFKEQSQAFKQAKVKLESEMDVVLILKKVRYLLNYVKMVTTDNQRSLLRMQANPGSINLSNENCSDSDAFYTT